MTASTATSSSRRNRRTATWVGGAAALVAGLGLVGSADALAPVPPLPGTGTIPVINLLPTASAVATPSVVAAGGSYTLDASASRDLDGNIVKWEFDQDGDGVYETRSHTPTVQQATATLTGPSRTVTARVRVTDDGGATAVKTTTVTVHQPPVALLTADRAVPTVGDVVGYRATGSYDPDGGPVYFSWDLDGNGTFERSTGANPYVTTSFPVAGNQRIAVRVRDSQNATTDRDLQVRVNGRPVAVVAATPNPAVVGMPVKLSGASSTDDRGIVGYRWDLNGDGTFETDTAAISTTSTTFTAVGMAKVGLEVTDTDGAVDRSTVQISVNSAPVVDTSAPHVTVTPGRVVARHGIVRLNVTCPATELYCRSRIVLRGTGRLSGRVLGSGATVVPGGETGQIAVPLAPAARSALRRFGAIRVVARATAVDAAGNTATVDRSVTIRR